jgi:hypothetical protein
VDPFVGKLFAIANGKLRVKDYVVVGLKKLASDAEILDLFAKQRAHDIARRKAGDGLNTSPNNSLYTVGQLLNCRKRPFVFSFEPRCQGLCGSQK